MLQAVMVNPGEIKFQDVPVPSVGPDQVLVKIKRIGVCGSDIHVFHGQHPYVTYPLTQGHEVSGQIERLGEHVTGLSIGQKVTIEPQVTCGECHPCRHGKYNLCENLKVMVSRRPAPPASISQLTLLRLQPLPDTLSFDEGAMIEPLAVTVHAVRQARDISGSKVAVLGAGPIGILLTQSLKALGASEVMVTDISDFRLKIAKTCGADYVYNTRHLVLVRLWLRVSVKIRLMSFSTVLATISAWDKRFKTPERAARSCWLPYSPPGDSRSGQA
jgi:L-iditol 2-dehydrogenase